MARRAQRELRLLQEKAFALLDRGAALDKVAERLEVSARTVRRWCRRREAGALDGREAKLSARQQVEALAEMLWAECPAVAKVMLDLAKGGDVRAAALVVKLLGNTLTPVEERDDVESETALHDVERELISLPSAIASEIVGLLAEAESAAAGEGGSRGARTGGGERRSRRLPWQENDHPPREGAGSV